MDHQIVADFEKRYSGGPGHHVRLSLPARGPHVLVLFGPSGSGKTTILRCIAGLETPDSGTIVYGDETWFSTTGSVAPQIRKCGFVPQNYSLFPHLTVRQNVEYGVSSRDKSYANEMLQMFRIDDIAGRLPDRISGGQQQRVALARALAMKPRLLLLDEPLSALDAGTREALRDELRSLLKDRAIPAICVTHDWSEALALGDRIAVISKGQILQHGLPEDVFSHPESPEIAAILGVDTVVVGRVEKREKGMLTLRVGSIQLTTFEPKSATDEYYVCIRPENVAVELRSPTGSSIRNHLPARIKEIRPQGALLRVILDCGFDLVALLTNQAAGDLQLQRGAEVVAAIKATAIHLIPKN